MRALVALFALIFIGVGTAQADAQHPPLEAYGELPGYRLFALSPDGSHGAFISRRDGRDIVALFTTETGDSKALMSVDKISVRDLFFADEEHLILVVSNTARQYGFRGKWEDSAAFTINIKTGKRKSMLRGTDGIYPAQTGLGDVVGRYTKESKVFMPAFYGRPGDDPAFHVFAVNLDTGLGRVYEKGLSYTRDWFLDEDGTVIAREDYSNDRDFYKIWTYENGKRKLVYEVDAEQPPFSLVGVKADKSALILVTHSDDTEEGFSAVYEMGFDGTISAPVFARPDADIERIFMDNNRMVLGVAYSGNLPSYDFYDPDLDAAVKEVTDALPGVEVIPVAWSEDWQKIVYRLFGNGWVDTYMLQNRTDGSFTTLASSYPGIPPETVGDVIAITYKATDGLTIPAIVTWPAGSTEETRKNLPLVVMPHGGPASNDSLSFDWMAQYYANRGYLVLQPNFRGSTGYGAAFRHAGDGEWGGKMQDDITDGVNALIKTGMADPDRVCIVGASYGGYAALAGGAYTPDLYKCVVAIAPVSDLPRMLTYVRTEYGRRHWALDYWKGIVGDPSAEKDKLERISPVNSANTFTAPVLLIHGRDDTVVPLAQSRVMESALKRAGKDVRLVELKAEDHWLSDGETRIMTLQAMGDFVDTHIGGK